MIYLLEDDESIRKLVTYTLQHAGYEAAGPLQGSCRPVLLYRDSRHGL